MHVLKEMLGNSPVWQVWQMQESCHFLLVQTHKYLWACSHLVQSAAPAVCSPGWLGWPQLVLWKSHKGHNISQVYIYQYRGTHANKIKLNFYLCTTQGLDSFASNSKTSNYYGNPADYVENNYFSGSVYGFNHISNLENVTIQIKHFQNSKDFEQTLLLDVVSLPGKRCWIPLFCNFFTSWEESPGISERGTRLLLISLWIISGWASHWGRTLWTCEQKSTQTVDE